MLQKAPVALSIVCLSISSLSAAPAIIVDNKSMPNNGCPATNITKIQDAVDMAGYGDVIRVCPGIYDEQVTIGKSVHIAGDNGATIQPAGMTANATNLVTGDPIAAVFLIQNAREVVLTDLIVDGSGNGITACLPKLMGVVFQNATGKLTHAVVRNIKLGGDEGGCQSGVAVFAQSLAPGATDLKIDGNSIHDYQKNGIVVNGTGTQVLVQQNVVTGSGPNPLIAQNGIQFADGAAGDVRGNIAGNHVYSPCASLEDCAAVSTDVLILDCNNVAVVRNVLGSSQSAIFYQGNGGSINNNRISSTLVFDGIQVVGDNNTTVINDIVNSQEAGIFVAGKHNTVAANNINEAPIGIWNASGTNTIANNLFFNTLLDVLTGRQPPSMTKAGTLSAGAPRTAKPQPFR